MSHPTVEEAIEKNLVITYVEPGDDDYYPVRVSRTCTGVIALGRAVHTHMTRERPEIARRISREFPDGYPDREIVLHYIAVHWAKINPPNEETETTGDTAEH